MLRPQKTQVMLGSVALTMLGIIFSSALLMCLVALTAISAALLTKAPRSDTKLYLAAGLLSAITGCAFHLELWLLGMLTGYPLAGAAAYLGAVNTPLNNWQPS